MELVYHTETERIIIEMKSLPRLLGPSDKPRMIALLLTAASLMAGNTRAGDAAGAALLEGQPAAWLSTDGKSDEWKITTSRCRELLGRLASHDALAEQYLPRVNEKARLLRQSPNLDWKKKTAVEYLENMLEDLLAGRAPHERYAGREFGYPYWSNTMQRIEALWMHVPPKYDPAKTYQFFMYYKCGGGIHLKDGRVAGGYRPTIDVANRSDSFHAWSSLDIQVKGRRGAQIELEEATAAVCRDFSVDPDRIFLTGWSDGGFTAVWLASRYPHLVAGIAPVCANWQYGNIENVGLANVPTLAVDGWTDGGYNSSQFCRWQALHGLGADACCIWGHHGHSYQPYEDAEEFGYIMDWAKGKRRDLYPKKVRYATWNLHWNRAYWFSIDRVEDPTLAAQFEAEVTDANRVEVRVWNVAAYKLNLNAKLVDTEKPLAVVTNGKQSYLGPFRAELSIELGPRPSGRFVKDASLPDDMAAAIIESSYATPDSGAIPARRWLAVRPTEWDEKAAGLLAKWVPKGAVADRQVSDEEITECNLQLYGGPSINKLTARIAAELPARFDAGRFTLGRVVYDQPSHCVAMLHPNPLNPKKYVIVYAFNDAATFAEHGFFGMTGGSMGEFRSGDCVVSGIPAERRRWGAALEDKAFVSRRLLFDAAWKVDASPPLGALARPLNYQQVLRLKADAVREAAGADVGVIWEYTPSWNRWGDSWPAGPITLHDLAAIDIFPENVAVAELTGAELLRSDPAASTVVGDRRDPAYDGVAHLSAADIDPGKTFRVAMGHFGTPAYGVEPPQMPRLFPFARPQDFLTAKSTRMGLTNFRQLPLQVVEATAQYIQRHKRISPRPVCFDLTEYVINPRDNEFGACDWLHLAVDAPSSIGAAEKPGRRYTLNLGLRLAGEPEVAPPRGNSKRLLELDRTKPEAAVWDFSTLDKKLPVALRMQVQSRAVVADKELKEFSLVANDTRANDTRANDTRANDTRANDTRESVLGRCLLLSVKLANAGTRDIDATAIVSASELRQIWRQTWPDEEDKHFQGYYAGYHQAVGEYQKPPTREDAALLLFSGPVPKTTRLIARRAGYNFGLAGVSAPLTIRGGQSRCLPLLLISLDRPRGTDVSLAKVLDALKTEWMSRGE